MKEESEERGRSQRREGGVKGEREESEEREGGVKRERGQTVKEGSETKVGEVTGVDGRWREQETNLSRIVDVS